MMRISKHVDDENALFILFFWKSFDKTIRPTNSNKQIMMTKSNTLPPIIMEVETSPFGDKPHIFQDPIFHGTMIMGGRVQQFQYNFLVLIADSSRSLVSIESICLHSQHQQPGESHRLTTCRRSVRQVSKNRSSEIICFHYFEPKSISNNAKTFQKYLEISLFLECAEI